MFQIVTEGKHRLLLTRAHPVFTSKGAVMARDLKVGDQVLTKNGKTDRIAAIKTVQHTGRVYNLQLGEREEAQEGKLTFFANGILVGDLYTQAHYEKLERARRIKDPAHARDRLPKEWHADFDNHIKAQKP